MKERKELVSFLEDSLINNVGSWSFHTFALEHISGIRLYVGAGIFSVSVISPVTFEFNYFQRKRIWKAVNIARAKYMLRLKDKTSSVD